MCSRRGRAVAAGGRNSRLLHRRPAVQLLNLLAPGPHFRHISIRMNGQKHDAAWRGGDDPVPENDQSPLGTRELAEMTGMSATFIREEIRAGVLRAVAIGRGRRRVFRISVTEARRYLRELGLL